MRKSAAELQFQVGQPLETKSISELSQNEVMKRDLAARAMLAA
jgi:hypothetical protein